MIRVVAGLLAALFACTSSAVAQAPSESTWRSLTTTGWIEVCAAPCRVANPSSYAVRLAVGSAAPSSSDAPAIELTPDHPSRDFGVIGTRVYGRAVGSAARVVVEPLSGGAGGGSANPYPGSDYATAGRQDTTITALGAPADAEAQTGNGSLIGVSKGQRAILRLLLDSYGAVADAAAASGNGSMIALTKALRDKVATAANQSTANASLASIDGKTPALVNGGQPVTVLNQAATGSMEQDVRSTAGTLNAASTSSTIDIPVNGQSTAGLRFQGLAASGATVSYFQSNDGGTTFTPVSEVNTATGVTSLTRTTDGQVRVAVQGRTTLRLQVTTAGSGTISVAWNVSVREGLVSLASPVPPGSNIIGRTGIDQTTPGTTNAVANQGYDGTTWRNLRTTTTGALEPPTAATGKIVSTSTTLTANTSTQLVGANDQRIAMEIQCDGTAVVGVSRTGAALTSATAAPLVIPTGSYPLYTMPVVTLTAVTAYTGTGQVCRVTEYLR